MQCKFCHRDVPSLVRLRVYSKEGVLVCGGCYDVITSHRQKPFSKVMDELAIAEAGYLVNRKLARLRL